MTTILVAGDSEGVHGRCDARCHGAKTPSCDCICGGRYHGAGSSADAEDRLERDLLGGGRLPVEIRLHRERALTERLARASRPNGQPQTRLPGAP